jgi:hypothetical protein
MRAPMHLWVIAILSLLWNGMGAFDYVMTMTRNPTYMDNFNETQLAYLYGFPSWVVGFWALGVWGAVAGSLLLIARSRGAIWAFVISLTGITVTWAWQFVLSPSHVSEVMGQAAVWFSAVIVIVAFLLLWYARAMKIRGVLE